MSLLWQIYILTIINDYNIDVTIVELNTNDPVPKSQYINLLQKVL